MSESKEINILAIESSCDETAAAVVRNGREVRSNIISSQIDLHKLRYTAAWFRRSPQESILRRLIR